MGSPKKVTVGYEYFLGLDVALCHGPIDKILAILFDDRDAWTGDRSSGSINIDKTDLFGGQPREGGVSGQVDIQMGGGSQGINNYLNSKITGLVPAYRGISRLVFNHFYFGNNPYFKKISVKAQRINAATPDLGVAWNLSLAKIASVSEDGLSTIFDMNPAHIILECLRNFTWGMGYGPSDVDSGFSSSFELAATTLFNESFGLSFLWDRQNSMDQFIKEILKTINGTTRVSIITGKIELKLIRDDYVIEDLFVADETNIEEVISLSKSGASDVANTVTVTYWNNHEDRKSSVTVDDPAEIQMHGGPIPASFKHLGISSQSLAITVANRELKVLTSRLIKCKLFINRTAHELQIGDAFLFSHVDYQLTPIVMRVMGIDYGTPDKNHIKIEGVQDVFSLAKQINVNTNNSGDDPLFLPVADVVNRIVVEAPYYQLVQAVGDDEAYSTINDAPDSGYLIASGNNPSNAINAEIIVDSGAGYNGNDSYTQFSPTVVTTSDIGRLTTSVPISDGQLLDQITVGSFAQIEDEIVRVDAISGSNVTIGRGVLDTVPAEHLSGTIIYFWSEFAGSDEVTYSDGETIDIKLLTYSGTDKLDEVDATPSQLTFDSRAIRPYPPGNVQVNGNYYPIELSLNTNDVINLTWSHRDRLQQTAGLLLDFTDGDVGPEPGTTYNIFVSITMNDDSVNNILFTSGITDNFYDIDLSLNPIPTPGNANTMFISVWAERDGFESWQKVEMDIVLFLTETVNITAPSVSISYDENCV